MPPNRLLAASPAVNVGVVPLDSDRARWPAEGFGIFDDEQVNVELVSGWLTLTQPREVAMYIKAFTELMELAVYGAQENY
ncbi:MAG: Scr1 family TA system antitoxin-like transcriptional regulator [Pseudonocardiaceae bacterium]